MPSETDQTACDPGRLWRRVIRSSVLFFVFMLWLTSELEGVSPWREFCYTLDFATTVTTFEQHDAWLASTYKIFSCCICGLYLMAPAMLILASPRIHRTGRARIPYLFVGIIVWMTALLPPYCFGVYQINAVDDTNLRAIFLSGLSFYLLIGLMTLINAWRNRGSAISILWLCLFPISTACLAMSSLLLGQWFGRSQIDEFVAIAVVGWIGCAFFTFAFFRWWLAVKRAQPANRHALRAESLKPQPATADTV